MTRPLNKGYAALFYVLRKTMVFVGNVRQQFWFSLVLITWVEGLLFISGVRWLQAFTGRSLPFGPVSFAVAVALVIGSTNYALLMGHQRYKEFEAEFSRYSSARKVLTFLSVYILLAGVFVLTFLFFTAASHLPGGPAANYSRVK